MYLQDFIFGDNRLSNYGYIVCSINTGNENSISMGSKIEFETTTNYLNWRNEIISSKYSDTISVTFDICKSECLTVNHDMAIKPNELRFLTTWLNSKKYLKFKPLYDGFEFNGVYYLGTFTDVSYIYYEGKIIGLTLTFTSNAPFGFQEDTVGYYYESNNPNWNFLFFNDSDDYKYSYPSVFTFTSRSSGDLIIQNSRESLATVIKNVSNGEIINFDSVHKIITVGDGGASHNNIYKDFNYVFPRFLVETDNIENEITVSLPGIVHVICEPVRKVGIFA